MPLQRIDLATGRTPEQRSAIADAVHRALVETMAVPQEDRFQVVVEHPQGALVITPEYLGIPHRNAVLVQITLNAGRTLDQKQKLYRRMAELAEEAGVPPGELVVSLVEVVKENWSFGGGIAQYAT